MCRLLGITEVGLPSSGNYDEPRFRPVTQSAWVSKRRLLEEAVAAFLVLPSPFNLLLPLSGRREPAQSQPPVFPATWQPPMLGVW